MTSKNSPSSITCHHSVTLGGRLSQKDKIEPQPRKSWPIRGKLEADWSRVSASKVAGKTVKIILWRRQWVNPENFYIKRYPRPRSIMGSRMKFNHSILSWQDEFSPFVTFLSSSYDVINPASEPSESEIYKQNIQDQAIIQPQGVEGKNKPGFFKITPSGMQDYHSCILSMPYIALPVPQYVWWSRAPLTWTWTQKFYPNFCFLRKHSLGGDADGWHKTELYCN